MTPSAASTRVYRCGRPGRVPRSLSALPTTLTDDSPMAAVIESLEASGFVDRCQIVRAKSRFVLERGDDHWQHEPFLYAVRKGTTRHWQGARDQATLWSTTTGGDEDAATVHGTQKPVECMRRPMVKSSARSDAVHEPFCGSGSTIVAAETTGRICYAMDVDAHYVDVAFERWQRITGKSALLAGKERTFSDMTACRCAPGKSSARKIDVVIAPQACMVALSALFGSACSPSS